MGLRTAGKHGRTPISNRYSMKTVAAEVTRLHLICDIRFTIYDFNFASFVLLRGKSVSGSTGVPRVPFGASPKTAMPCFSAFQFSFGFAERLNQYEQQAARFQQP
jgi:hypothetical protein